MRQARKKPARSGRPKPATKRRPQQRGLETRERLVEAALEVFARHGFDGATTREIAAAAGVPQGLVTYHYASKQALWEAAVDWLFGEVAVELASTEDALRDLDPVTRLRAAMKRFVRFAARHPELQRFMTHEGSHDGPRLRWLVQRHVRPLFDQSIAAIREALPGIDAVHFHYALLGAMSHAFAVAPEFTLVTGRDALSPETVEAHASSVVDWLVDGALARTPALAAPAPRARRSRSSR
jgi:AcrR family transcriptional regulator